MHVLLVAVPRSSAVVQNASTLDFYVPVVPVFVVSVALFEVVAVVNVVRRT